MFKIDVSIKDYATISVYTDFKSIKDKFLLPNCSIKRTIPITKISCHEINNNEINYLNAIVINSSDNKSMYYDKKYNVSVLIVNEESIRFPDLVYIMLSMFSNILQEQNKYLLHSSALQYNEKNAFALVGDANAGKTSLAYELIDKHGCKLISNDHSIIGLEEGKLKIFGGTKEIQMRLGAIEMYFPDLYKKINIEDENKWNRKIIVNDYIDEELVVSEDTDELDLTCIYSINTSNSGNSFIRQKEYVDELLFMYESLSRIIKGTYNLITGFNYAMPSMETKENLQKLANNCSVMLNSCDVFEGKGTVKDLAKLLVKRYEKK